MSSAQKGTSWIDWKSSRARTRHATKLSKLATTFIEFRSVIGSLELSTEQVVCAKTLVRFATWQKVVLKSREESGTYTAAGRKSVDVKMLSRFGKSAMGCCKIQWN